MSFERFMGEIKLEKQFLCKLFEANVEDVKIQKIEYRETKCGIQVKMCDPDRETYSHRKIANVECDMSSRYIVSLRSDTLENVCRFLEVQGDRCEFIQLDDDNQAQMHCEDDTKGKVMELIEK